MKMMFSLALVSLVTACATDDGTDVTDEADADALAVTTSDIHINSRTDLVEPAFVSGLQCKMVFPGGLTAQTQMYQIWAVGTHGIVNTPYNTSAHPNLYAVFGTSTPASQTHHVNGYNQFDHYHVLDFAPGNTVWDLLTYWPGPNYNAATYHPARSVHDLQVQTAAGILTGVKTLPEVGFPEVVLNFPVTCF